MLATALGGIGVLAAPLPIRLREADPSYYLSYVLDYGDVAARFGQTYHGNRLSYILIDRLGFALLGPEVGYLAVRWVLLAIAALAVVAIIAPRAGAVPAATLAAAVTLTPWLPQQLLWTHYDGPAAVLLLVAGALLLGDAESTWRQVAAGALLALVINSNLGFAVVVASGVVAWAVAAPLARRERLRALLRIAAGGLAALVALSLTVRLLVGSGPWFSEWVAIRTALLLVGDDTWFTPLPVAVAGNPLLALLPVLGLGALVAARRPAAVAGRADAARLGGVWLLTTLAAVLALHLAASSGWLGNPYYVVALMPATVAAAAGLLERLSSGVGPWPTSARFGGPVVAGWILLLALLWRTSQLQRWALWVASIALAAVVAAVFAPRSSTAVRRSALLLVPVVLIVTWAAPVQVPGREGFPDLEARAGKEWTLFNAVRGVKEVVVASVPPSRDLAFWHRVDGVEGEWLRQVNMAYYGGGTGRLHADRGDDPYGMPELRGEQIALLRDRSPISVVLLGLDRSEVTAGIVALITRVPDAEVATQSVIPGATFDLYVAVIEIG